MPIHDAVNPADPPVIHTDYSFTATVEVGEPLTVEHSPDGVRRYIPITGGTVAGPRLTGIVLAVGGDSQVIRSDGVIALEATYMIKTNDDVLISVVNRGLRRAPPAVMARMMKGDRVNREHYYFRTVAQLAAPLDSRYADLNASLFLGTAEREPDAAVIHLYRVL